MNDSEVGVDNQKIKNRFQRFEFKYFLPKREMGQMYSVLLRNHLVRDPFLELGQDGYSVNSIYFDSPTLRCYNEKISGMKNRAKLRLRTYGEQLDNPQTIFLEIKRKSDAIVVKDRTFLSIDNYRRAISGEVLHFEKNDRDSDILEEFTVRQRSYSMLPLVSVRYKRNPLVSRFDNNLRITFDYDIEAAGAGSFTDRKNFNPIFRDLAIMEIKYNNILPGWLHKVIQKHELNREAFSKYCYGIDTIKKNNQLKY